MPLTWSLPIRLVNPKNAREHWRTTARRTKHERGLAVAMTNNLRHLVDLIHDKNTVGEPFRVTITRVGPKNIDDDNVAFSSSGLRDGICDVLKVDDGDRSKIRFSYRQKIGDYGVTVRIE